MAPTEANRGTMILVKQRDGIAGQPHGVLPIPISNRGLILANTDSDIIIIVLVVLASEAENEIS